MATRPLDKLIGFLTRRKPRVMVIVQTERGQVAVPADQLRTHLRRR